jgi:iron complex outermembrane receptor protein
MIMTRSRRFAFLFALALASAVQAGEGAGPTRKVSFEITAPLMRQALLQFTEQSGLQLAFPLEGTTELPARRVVGDFTPGSALEQLLAGSGLSFEFVNERTVRIGTPATEHEPGSAGLNGESRLRLARADELSAQPDVAAEYGAGLDEIVVTAQKRSESLTQVPISITTFDADELEAMRVQGVEDFVFSIPNASYYSTGRSAPRVSLRGVSSVTGGQFDPIAITVDDASFGGTSMRTILGSRVFDVERMEVLRGPQGTLTGASSLGGTINIITAKPDVQAFSVGTTLDVSRFNTMLAKGVLNTPLSDTFALRTVAFTDRSDGAVKNVGPAGGDSGHDNVGARVAARWLAAPHLTFDASIAYEEQRFGIDSSLYIDRFAFGEREGAVAQLEALGGVFYDSGVDFIEKVGNNGGRVRYDNPDFTNVKNLIASFRASYRLANHAIDLIYGRFNNDLSLSLDVDDSEFAVQRNYWTWYDDADSAELRISSAYGGRLDWVGGISHQQEEFQESGGFDAGDGLYAGSYSVAGLWRTYQKLESQAAFANVFWQLADKWRLSAGARVTRVKTGFSDVCCGEDTGSGFVLPPLDVARTSRSTEFTPRVALNYDVLPNASLYAQFATGYRPGYGNDPRAVGIQETDFGTFDVREAVDPEQVENYELGVKGFFFDRRLSVAAAAFNMDYTDLQVTAGYVGDDFVLFDVNAGKARTRGFELETAFRPVEALELRANVGYVDATIEELEALGTTITDIDMPQVRPWTGNFTTIFQRPVRDGRRVQLRADYTWQAQAFTAPDEAPDEELPRFGKVDFSVGMYDDRWSLSAYMENVFDEIFWTGTQGGYALRGHKAPFVPRTFGLRFTYQYGE